MFLELHWKAAISHIWKQENFGVFCNVSTFSFT